MRLEEVQILAKKANCWEAKKCGREVGGARTAELGVCAASTAARSGSNSGMQGGRVCWAVSGTLCGGKVQGTFAQKVAGCMACDFYQAVKREEGANFKLMPAN
jgi:hypothetical protein